MGEMSIEEMEEIGLAKEELELEELIFEVLEQIGEVEA